VADDEAERGRSRPVPDVVGQIPQSAGGTGARLGRALDHEGERRVLHDPEAGTEHAHADDHGRRRRRPQQRDQGQRRDRQRRGQQARMTLPVPGTPSPPATDSSRHGLREQARGGQVLGDPARERKEGHDNPGAHRAGGEDERQTQLPALPKDA